MAAAARAYCPAWPIVQIEMSTGDMMANDNTNFTGCH
jgi:hypothetical protein